MNPMLMQMWLAAFTAYVEANWPLDGESMGYKAAKYADEVIAGAQRAATEMQAAASKLVTQ